MNTIIRFKNIISVQLKEEVASIRIGGEETKINSDVPILKLQLKTKIAEKAGYRPFESDIMKYIINAILENCKVSDRNDLPLINEIISNATQIAMSTRRSAGNFAIFSESAAKEFEEKYSHYLLEDTINGIIKAFVSPHLKEGVIVGYSGGKFDSGLVLSIVDNQYQIVNIEGSERYYRYIPRR